MSGIRCPRLLHDPVGSVEKYRHRDSTDGFCEVVDGADPDDAAALEELGLDHLVRFFARTAADAFEEDPTTGDNGLRVTLHLVDVEFGVCAVREGGAIEVFDLRVSPPAVIDIADVENTRLRTQLQNIVL